MLESDSPSLELEFTGIIQRLTAVSSVRDEAVTQGRLAIRHAANSVRAAHRGDVPLASSLLHDARQIVMRLRSQTVTFPQIFHAGYVQDAMKEFAEAAITLAILTDAPIPSSDLLGVEDPAWLNALAEAGSELRRDVLDLLRSGNIDRAGTLLNQMDDIYAMLVTIDFPDAITSGLRRTTDQYRAVLERTRGDLTLTTQQRRLEDAIASLQSDLRQQLSPES